MSNPYLRVKGNKTSSCFMSGVGDSWVAVRALREDWGKNGDNLTRRVASVNGSFGCDRMVRERPITQPLNMGWTIARRANIVKRSDTNWAVICLSRYERLTGTLRFAREQRKPVATFIPCVTFHHARGKSTVQKLCKTLLNAMERSQTLWDNRAG